MVFSSLQNINSPAEATGFPSSLTFQVKATSINQFSGRREKKHSWQVPELVRITQNTKKNKEESIKTFKIYKK